MMGTQACQQYLMWHFIGTDRQTGREREPERGAKRKLRVRFWNLQWSCNTSLAWLSLMSGCPPSWNAAFIIERPLWAFRWGCLEQRRGVGGLPSSSHSGRAPHCCSEFWQWHKVLFLGIVFHVFELSPWQAGNCSWDANVGMHWGQDWLRCSISLKQKLVAN